MVECKQLFPMTASNDIALDWILLRLEGKKLLVHKNIRPAQPEFG